MNKINKHRTPRIGDVYEERGIGIFIILSNCFVHRKYGVCFRTYSPKDGLGEDAYYSFLSALKDGSAKLLYEGTGEELRKWINKSSKKQSKT